MQQHSFLFIAPSRAQMGGICASLLTKQERHILGKMNLHLLGSVGCMKQQGWDIWAAASHPNTWMTSPWLVNPHIAPRGILGETVRRLSKHCLVLCKRQPGVTFLP